MNNIETYEQNLHPRLIELRQGDPAYDRHRHAIQDAIIFASENHGDTHKQRILDCGCGLGFVSTELCNKYTSVVGIDPSEKAIALAKQEHNNIPFYHASAESFSEIMPQLDLQPFDQVVLNMVLHSVDDQSVSSILEGVRKCLRPEGTVLIIVPTHDWLIQKLVEYAQDQGMEREVGLAWLAEKLKDDAVEIPVRIRNGGYYPSPLLLYNRTIADYGEMLSSTGFGVKWGSYSEETGEHLGSTTLPYHILYDYTTSNEIICREKVLLMSFALIDEDSSSNTEV